LRTGRSDYDRVVRGLGAAIAVMLGCGRIGFDGANNAVAVDAPRDAPADAGIAVPIASDDFARAIASGWGNADLGGAWNIYNPDSSAVSVASGHGIVSLATTSAYADFHVPSADALDSETRAVVTFDTVPTSGSYTAAISVRWVTISTDYRLHLDVFAGGSASAYIEHGSAGGYAPLTSPISTSVAPAAGLTLALRATGASPTRLCGKLWADGGAEPTTCTVSVSDSTTELQVPGSSYLITYNTNATAPTVAFAAFRFLRVGPM
jgi:hypothetical protein